MGVLTRDAILAEIGAGRLVIDPYSADQVGPASIDLTLGDEIRVIEVGLDAIPIADDVDWIRFALVANEVASGVEDFGFGGFDNVMLTGVSPAPPVPEPTSIALVGLAGVLGVAGIRFRRRRDDAANSNAAGPSV